MYELSPLGLSGTRFTKIRPGSSYTHKPYDPAILASSEGLIDQIEYPYPAFNITGDMQTEYLSAFGPHFYIPSLCFPGSTNNDYKLGLSRMLALRKPEKPGLAARLRGNQDSISRNYRGYIHRFSTHFHHHLSVVDHEKAYFSWLFQPHAKKKLRMKTHEDDLKYLDMHADTNASVQYKLKAELLRCNKKRAIADLGARRTQVSAWCIAQLKLAWEVPFCLGRAESRYIASPDKDVLTDTFRWMNSTPLGATRYIYFSDDACMAIGCKDGLFLANGDISSCDGSHHTPFFQAFRDLVCTSPTGEAVYSKAVDYALGALKQPLVMKNKYVKGEQVKYKFTSLRLYSGSVLTTIVNNFANLLIFFAMLKRCPDPSLVTKAQYAKIYVLAAADVGYIVKCQHCECQEDMQFLKHSPVLASDGQYHACMNLAVFYRGFGCVYGDLPSVYGKSNVPLETRARRYLSDVVTSRRGWGNHSLNSAFLGMTLDASPTDNALREVLIGKSTGGAGVTFSLSSLSTRYRRRGTPCADVTWELDELATCTSLARVGSIVKLPIVSHLYDIDYG